MAPSCEDNRCNVIDRSGKVNVTRDSGMMMKGGCKTVFVGEKRREENDIVSRTGDVDRSAIERRRQVDARSDNIHWRLIIIVGVRERAREGSSWYIGYPQFVDGTRDN